MLKAKRSICLVLLFSLLITFTTFSITLAESIGTGLKGDYCDEMDFTGLKFSRIDPAINFNWGSLAPDSNMGADKYSIRWYGQVQPLYTETYTFYTNTDGGVRLWVDGQLLIDNFFEPSTAERSGTITLTAGEKYDIAIYFYKNSGIGSTQLLWSSSSQTKQIIPQSRLYPPPTGSGLVGRYYDNEDFTDLKLTRTDKTVDFNWGTDAPEVSMGAGTYSVRWDGRVQPLYTETYTFYLASCQGARLWVNEELIIDDWISHAGTERSGTIALAAGVKYDIRIELYNVNGSGLAKLLWHSASQTRQIIPQSQLFEPSTKLDADDPFAPYFTKVAPPIVTDLGTTISGNGLVSVHKFVFQSRIADTSTGLRPSQIYAVIARPIAAGTYPGIMLYHGGTGCAEEGLAIEYASRGYIAATCDLPGIASTLSKIPNSTGRWKDFSDYFIKANPDVTESQCFDAVLAAMQTLYFLQAEPNLDLSRIGAMGKSWGGYMTTMISGLSGNAIKAALPYFGTGFYEQGSTWKSQIDALNSQERTAWLRYLDPGRRAKGITATLFHVAPTNDRYYWPPAVMANLSRVTSPKNQVFYPNTNHTLPGFDWEHILSGTAGAIENNFLDRYLLNTNAAELPVVTIESAAKQADSSIKVFFQVDSPTAISNAALYYSTSFSPWQVDKTWTSVAAVKVDTTHWTATIPASAADQSVDWFAFVTDSRSAVVSSLMGHNADIPNVNTTWAQPTTTTPVVVSSNLALKKPITASNSNPNSALVVTNANDGNQATYWEAASRPVNLTVDLGQKQSVSKVVLKLKLNWGTRTQTLSILGSDDGITYRTIVDSATYTFTSNNSETVIIDFPTTKTKYIRLNMTNNSVSVGGVAQLSEIEIYGLGVTSFFQYTSKTGITGIASIVNGLDKDRTINLCIGVYDKNNKLVDVVMETVIAKKDSTSSATIDLIPKGVNDTDEYTVKMFSWDEQFKSLEQPALSTIY